jgi:hypothetical protein
VKKSLTIVSAKSTTKKTLPLSAIRVCAVGTDINAIASQWLEQLKDNLTAVHDILARKNGTVREWMNMGVANGSGRFNQIKYNQIYKCLLESNKVISLLKQQEIKIREYRKDKTLFKDDFDSHASLKNWFAYGDGAMKIVDKRLQLLDPRPVPDNHVWTNKQFSGDFIIEFDFEALWPPVGGQITSYCALPRVPSADLSGSGKGWMDNYYKTITCYHFSFARGNSRVCNMRKCGKGLWMCANSFDPCPNRNMTYHVKIAKIKNNHLFLVNNELVHHYIDVGVYGDSLYNKGYIGLRNWTGLLSYYDNFKVSRLSPASATKGMAVDWKKVVSIELPNQDPLDRPMKQWNTSSLKVLSKLLTSPGTSNHALIFNANTLKQGTEVKVKLFNPFASAQTFNLDWSAYESQWQVKPWTRQVKMDAQADTILSFQFKNKRMSKTRYSPVCFLKSHYKGKAIGKAEVIPIAYQMTEASKTDKGPKIDGRLNEKLWADKNAIPGRLRYSQQSITVDTKAFLAYDESHLYFAMECTEPSDLKSLKGNPDFLAQNTAEVYFSPSGRGFYKVTVRADGKSTERKKNNGTHRTQPYLYAVALNGNSWAAELAVPIANVSRGNPIKKGSVWRFNFTRQRTTKSGKEEYGTWCGDFNSEWQFGYLKFK